MRKLFLMGIAALMLCAVAASSASALEVYNKSTNLALPVGEPVTATTDGTSTLTGTFFGFGVTINCAHSAVHGTVTSNGGATVLGSITSASWTGCGSNLKNPCTVSPAGLPWHPSTNEGGLVAESTTVVGVSPGTSGAVDVTDCLNGLGTCTVTGATASTGGLVNVVVGTFNSANSTLGINAGVKAKNCTASGMNWTADYTLTSTGAPVGLR